MNSRFLRAFALLAGLRLCTARRIRLVERKATALGADRALDYADDHASLETQGVSGNVALDREHGTQSATTGGRHSAMVAAMSAVHRTWTRHASKSSTIVNTSTALIFAGFALLVVVVLGIMAKFVHARTTAATHRRLWGDRLRNEEANAGGSTPHSSLAGPGDRWNGYLQGKVSSGKNRDRSVTWADHPDGQADVPSDDGTVEALAQRANTIASPKKSSHVEESSVCDGVPVAALLASAPLPTEQPVHSTEEKPHVILAASSPLISEQPLGSTEEEPPAMSAASAPSLSEQPVGATLSDWYAQGQPGPPVPYEEPVGGHSRSAVHEDESSAVVHAMTDVPTEPFGPSLSEWWSDVGARLSDGLNALHEATGDPFNSQNEPMAVSLSVNSSPRPLTPRDQRASAIIAEGESERASGQPPQPSDDEQVF